MLGETCPRGFICINHFHALLALTGVIVIIYYVNQNNYRDLYKKINNLSNNEFEDIKQSIVNNDSLLSPHNDIKHAMSNHLFYQNSNDVLQRDRKVINNPLYPPLKRDYHIEEEAPRGIPINIETRGSGGNFQQIGILSENVIADDNQTPIIILIVMFYHYMENQHIGDLINGYIIQKRINSIQSRYL